MLDSGCTQHMIENGRMFTSIDNEGSKCDKITFGDNSKGKVKGLGKIAISNDLSISNVLLVESLSYNLLSVAQLCDLGLICKFSPKDVVITSIKSDELIFKGFRYGNLYLVDFTSNDASLSTCLFTKSSKGWLWHRRLAHVGMNQLKKLMKHDLVICLKNDIVFEKNKLCSACQAGKQVGNTHPTKSVMSTSRPLELLHMVTIQDLTPQGMSPIVAPEKTESGMKPIEPTGKINDAGSDFTSIQTGRHDPAN